MFLNTNPLQLNVLTASPTLDVVVTYTDHTTAEGAASESPSAQITSTGLSSIVAAPSASTTRQVQEVSVYNGATAVARVQPRLDSRAAGPVFALAPGETLSYAERRGGWAVYTAAGVEKKQGEGVALGGYTVAWFKTGSAPEAAGVGYLFGKDAGFPGVWAPGTPGVGGRATDGTLAADAGCLPVRTPAGGASAYMTRYEQTGTVAHRAELIDLVWVNSGLVVTTTTEQTVSSVAFPARDRDGSSNGVGYVFGIYVSSATTNAAVVTTITASYTNEAGVPGRVATLPSFPATAVAGSLIPFRLAAGDTGVRSIQGITLGTTLGGGAIHLVAYKLLAAMPSLNANVGNDEAAPMGTPGVRLYPGVCLLPAALASSTTAVTAYGSIIVTEVSS